jgi:glucose-6-phosphate isomerase
MRTSLKSWESLVLHAKDMKTQHMNQLFLTDEKRFSKFSIMLPTMLLDYSKNLLTTETMQKLIELSQECDIETWRNKMFIGERINRTEDRAVLHTALHFAIES